ncbi:hypothetical protein ACTJKH_17510 [Microbacterium sp. 22215]|uniref:hypothetical protein n=1 Tax=Microbacterium sp. 22215 TaxID=3453893 RepID=UPI003F847D86
MDQAKRLDVSAYISRAALLSGVLGMVLGAIYQLLLLRSVLGEAFQLSAEAMLKTGVMMTVIILVGSVGAFVAYLRKAGMLGKIVGALFTGLAVSLMTWSSWVLLFGFPLFAGAVASIAFLLLLLVLPPREVGTRSAE